MILHNAGFGTKKGIPTTLIAASSFDDIIAITVFAVFLSISFAQAKGGELAEIEGAEIEEQPSIWVGVGLNLAQIVGGFIAGIVVGWTMKIFNRCKP